MILSNLNKDNDLDHIFSRVKMNLFIDNISLKRLPLKTKVEYIINYNHLNEFKAKDILLILKKRDAVMNFVDERIIQAILIELYGEQNNV